MAISDIKIKSEDVPDPEIQTIFQELHIRCVHWWVREENFLVRVRELIHVEPCPQGCQGHEGMCIYVIAQK